MNVDQALLAFREDEEKRSREAVQWALEHWDEASSRLVSRLRATLPILPLVYDAKDKAFDESDGVMVYYLMHLFAEKRDVRAYAPLCQRLQRERDVMVWLMDVAGDTLPGVLVALYDGDPEPLQRVVESAEADPLVRVAALGALCYIIRFEQALGEGAARDYLRRLYEHALPRGKSDFWEGWINAVALLGCSELAPDVARLFSKGWIDPEVATIQDFHGLLGEARADPKKAFDTFKLVPFASTMALLDAHEASGAHFGDLLNDEETGEAYQTPHLNPLREVGRNDPCPCGSGKKYKKCCLAA